MGVITDEDTGGVKLNFGSAEALTTMAEQVGKGEGFGKISASVPSVCVRSTAIPNSP